MKRGSQAEKSDLIPSESIIVKESGFMYKLYITRDWTFYYYRKIRRIIIA